MPHNLIAISCMNDCLVVYIERDVACSIDNEIIMHWFQNMKTRRSWESKLTITILKVLVRCYGVKGSADWANKKKGEKKQWCNTTCGWPASIDYRKLDSHIKKISCSSFVNKVKWVIWRIQGVVYLSRTTHSNHVYLENLFTLM